MLIGLFAIIGLVAGVALDALMGRLAWATPGGPPKEERVTADAPVLAAEGGALVVASEGSHWQRRLLVMGVAAGLFAMAAVRYDGAAELAIVTAYVCVLLVCAGTDLISYRVPNLVTYPAIVGAIVAGALMPDADILEVLAGGALTGGVLLVPSLITGGIGMGMGDVKLAAFVGLAVGFTHAAPAMLIMAIGGGAVATFLLVTGLRKKGEPIPYAPFISAGGLAVLFWQGAAFVSL
ncbi:MAG: prepilin peptidase [Chloroflexi bacterium]|nr:prepilin peptidase [Chloroflexota bacterium]